MIVFNIPGHEILHISYVLLDYNGTIAADGQLINGVADHINRLSEKIEFHVITADTFGSVEKSLESIDCCLHIISEQHQDEQKLEYLEKLGAQKTMSVGNGRNDRLMLENAAIGVAVLQEEGLCAAALQACDLMVRDVRDVFSYFHEPGRLIASLRN